MEQVKYGPYSPSRLEVANCPHRFKLQYMSKEIKDEGSLPAKRGNVVHETFEEITKGWLFDKPLNWDQVTEILTKKMAHYLLTNEEDQKTCIGASRCYMLNPPHNLDTVLGTEEQIAVKWTGGVWVKCAWDDPAACKRGKIDLLMIDDDNIATIIDHKTQLFVQDADTFQMGFYACLVKSAYPYIEGIRTILHFCHPDLDFYSKPTFWDPEALADVETRTKIAIGIAENMGDFPAIPNHHCQYCPIKMECPKLLEIRKRKPVLKKAKKGPLLSAKEAQEHAEAVTVLEENQKVMKSSLRTFVKEVGAVQIAGLEYAMIPSASYVVPLEKKKGLIEKLGEFGQDPYAYLDFSGTNLKKLWKVLTKEQLEIIGEYLEPKKTTSFRSRKV